jgi:diadenosine tetraphosphatase ApaH/serine/threonine PP2A family protein phosphatase
MPKEDVIVKNLDMPKGRIICISDIHGCLTQLALLHQKLDVDQYDTIIHLGDTVDRGPMSDAVIQSIRGFDNWHCVLGNHDAKVVRYHHHVKKQRLDPNYKIPMRVPESYAQLSEQSLEFLSTLPHAIMFKDFPKHPLVCCHAGLMPNNPFEQDPKAFIRNRYIVEDFETGKLHPAKATLVDKVWNIPESAKPWYHYWDGRYKVIYGHAVHKAPLMVNNTIGIDLGCCFGGFLCAWVYEPGYPDQFVYVKSDFKYEGSVE